MIHLQLYLKATDNYACGGETSPIGKKHSVLFGLFLNLSVYQKPFLLCKNNKVKIHIYFYLPTLNHNSWKEAWCKQSNLPHSTVSNRGEHLSTPKKSEQKNKQVQNKNEVKSVM